MDLATQYYYFNSVLTNKFCDEIIEYGKHHQESYLKCFYQYLNI